jgi:LruC domain-containing protein
MKKILYLASIFLMIAISSCKKQEITSDLLNSQTLSTSANFNWKSAKEVGFEIEVADTRFGNALHAVSVYTADPDNNGELLTEGSASTTTKFKSRIELAMPIQEVFVVKSAPNGTKISQTVPINGTSVKLIIGSESISGALAVNSSSKITMAKTSVATSPNCTTGCNFIKVLMLNDETVSVSNGQTLCVSGSNKTFNLNINSGGGTIRICGTNLTLKYVNDNSNGSAITIIVTSSGVVTLPTFNFNFANNTVENYGEITFSENLALPGKLYNYGYIKVVKDYNVNSLSNTISTHMNEGVIVVGGQMNINSNTILTNSKSITTEFLNVNSSGTLINNCKFIVNQDFIDDFKVTNNSYFKVIKTSKINSNALFSMNNGAMFQTGTMDALAGFIIGEGTTSLVKVLVKTNNNIILNASHTNNPKVKGAIQYCDNVSIPAGLFSGGAAQGCDVYIQKNDCNDQSGNGTPPVSNPDSDGDGIPDCNDKYPDDVNKAFDNYSINYAAGGTTTAFEDKWPIKGDYDMNDVVITARYLVVTNGANRVTQIKADYKLRATGGDFKNGAAVQFHIPKSNVSNLVATTGVNFEAGQDSAVLVLFTNSRAEHSEWNTIPGKPLSAVKNYAVSFEVQNGETIDNFGLGSYNLFIWNNTPGYGRTYETHLRGKKPTKLADPLLFNTGDDNSNMGVSYVTAGNLPWAIELPIANFSYPKETISMEDTYLKFNAWAASNGNLYADWYSNLSVTYRKAVNIF